MGNTVTGHKNPAKQKMDLIIEELRALNEKVALVSSCLTAMQRAISVPSRSRK
jgi:hypothetical protein